MGRGLFLNVTHVPDEVASNGKHTAGLKTAYALVHVGGHSNINGVWKEGLSPSMQGRMYGKTHTRGRQKKNQNIV